MVGLLPETNAAAETDVLLDAWDFKGRPAPRATTGRWGAAAMILVAELNERLTTLGIAVNLVTYLTGTMHLGNAESANVVTNFMGTSFMLCLLGGFVADSFLGRYLTIAIFTAVQASGVTILTISTAAPGLRPSPCSANANNGGECARATGAQLGVMYLALYLTALGTGGLKSSVSGFGSDQFDESDRGEKHQMMRFFNWFFFFISLGSLLAVTVLVYVQDNLGRRWGYGACACAIAAGLVVFLAGTRRYRFKKLAGSPLTQIAAVVVAAWRKRRLPLPADPAMLYDIDVGKAAAVEEGSTKKSKRKERLPHTDQFRFLDHAAINEEPAAQPSKWRLATLTDVEEVKTVVRMLPIWATTIMFWTVYAQMTTFSVSQATTMDRHIGSSFQIPAGSLTVFFVGSILLTVPVYDRIVVPVARRVSGNPHGLTPLQRIGVGLALSVIAMAGAALTEIRRLRVARDAAVPAGGVVPMSVFWLIPQFFLVGAGEAFTYIGQLDFFLRECPKGMKTMSTGLFLSTLSLGFFVSSALVAAVHRVTGDRHPWIADDLNKGRLDIRTEFFSDPTLPAHPHPGDPAGPGATAATFGPHAAGRRCSDPAGRRHDRPLARRKTDAEATGARAGCRRVPRQARRQGPRRAWLAHRVRGAGGQRKGRRCRRGRRPRPGARGSQRTGRAGPDGHGWGHGRQGLARSRPRPGVLRRRRRPTPSPPRRGSMLCRSRMEILVRYCRMTSRDGAHRGSGSASSSSPADAEDSMNSSSDRALPELRAKLLRRPP